MKINFNKIRTWFEKKIPLIFQFIFILIGGAFKEPLMFSIGVFGVLLFFYTSLSFLDDHMKLLDPLKLINEIFSAIIAYTLFIKKNMIAWRKRDAFAVIIEAKLREVKEKLSNIKYEIKWTEAKLKSITTILFSDWIKRGEQFQNIESEFVKAVDAIILSEENMTSGKRLFVQYVVYELFPLSRSKFLSELTHSDFSEGSASNEFSTIFDNAIKKEDKFNIKDTIPPLNKDDAKNIFDKLSTGNLAYYRKRIKNTEDRNALVAVAEQCIRMGYTSMDQILKFRREQQPFKMLIKYDERFTYFERVLKKESDAVHGEKKTDELVKKAMAILARLPFSHALRDYHDVIIQLMPRDPFVFLFDINLLYKKFKIKDVNKFMEQIVVPKAKIHHNEKINAIRKLDKAFATVKKDFIVNYYIIDIDIESLIVAADNKSIPEGMKKILLQDVLANGDFAQLLTTQDLYIKKIIESMPLDALLFSADDNQSMQNFLRSMKNQIQQAFKAAGIPNSSIYEKKDFKKNINKVTDAIYQVQEKKEQLMNKMTKKDIKTTVGIIAENASKLVTILEKGISQK